MTQEEKARAYDEALKRARKLYNDAKANEYKSDMEDYESIFPELAESEDERMIREIKRYIKEQGDKPNGLPNGTVAISDMIAWLEKQKEQKPSGETNVEPDSKIPREEYLYHLLANHIITFTDYTYLLAKKPFDYECANIPQKDYTPVEQKSADLSEMMVHKEPYIAPVPTPMVADEQKQEWSEEDEKILKLLILNIGRYKYFGGMSSERILAFLKSLRPQYHGDVTMTEAYKMGKEAGEASRWKPNEHQMNILKAVKDYVGKGSGYWGEGLGSLITDLEKLI